MPFVVAATYRAKPGEGDAIEKILRVMAPLSRQEPGCLFYQAHRSEENPDTFFLYEQYEDQRGYEAHKETEHFTQHILGDAIPRLESREVALYRSLD